MDKVLPREKSGQVEGKIWRYHPSLPLPPISFAYMHARTQARMNIQRKARPGELIECNGPVCVCVCACLCLRLDLCHLSACLPACLPVCLSFCVCVCGGGGAMRVAGWQSDREQMAGDVPHGSVRKRSRSRTAMRSIMCYAHSRSCTARAHTQS